MRKRNNDTWANDDNIPFQRAVERSWMAGRYISVTGASNGRRAGSTRGGGWMHAENTAREGGGRVKERHEGKRGQSVEKRNGDGGPP